jgi:hypothetical protein
MKKELLFFLVFLTFLANSQVTHRNINFTAKVVTELNEPLIAAIDRHIEVSKAKKIKNKSDLFILVSIFPKIKEWEIPKHVYDSIYAINDFKTIFPTDSVTPTYSITIVLASKNYLTEGWTGFERKNIYYYIYKNYDVLINTELDLIFNNECETKEFTQHLIIEKETKKISPFKIWTGYSMWNRYITEIRLKDLIWPQWTGKRNDF